MRFIVLLAGGMAWTPPPRSLAPSVDASKTDVARIGADLDAPLHLSWSCYNGRDRHCGRCGTCVERAEAFQDAGLTDPTDYEETTA